MQTGRDYMPGKKYINDIEQRYYRYPVAPNSYAFPLFVFVPLVSRPLYPGTCHAHYDQCNSI